VGANGTPAPPWLTRALLSLTAVTGLVDAVSFLGLGHVFTANMTGNVVFIGFAAAGAQGLSAARSLAALGAFLVGAVFGGCIATRASAGPLHRWAGLAFGAEAALFLAALAAALGAGSSLLEEPARLYAVIVLTGLAMGLRNATVRRLGVPDLTTTVLTLTITGLAADSGLAGGGNPGWRRRLAGVAAMLVGAFAGARLLEYTIAVPLALCGAVSGGWALGAWFGLRDHGAAPATTRHLRGGPTGAAAAGQHGGHRTRN
jgi:uncharacterized membrane protein YoaK (UPF0700 family)